MPDGSSVAVSQRIVRDQYRRGEGCECNKGHRCSTSTMCVQHEQSHDSEPRLLQPARYSCLPSNWHETWLESLPEYHAGPTTSLCCKRQVLSHTNCIDWVTPSTAATHDSCHRNNALKDSFGRRAPKERRCRPIEDTPLHNTDVVKTASLLRVPRRDTCRDPTLVRHLA